MMRGHAIEVRLCAEDVRNSFLPSTGRITYYKPSQGYAVREDSGISDGDEISIYYDPLFAKLIVWGVDRNDAIRKMQRALGEYRITGVETTIPFCQFVLDHAKFVDGDFQIDFVQQYFTPDLLPSLTADEMLAAALTAALHVSPAGKTAQPTSRNGSSRTVNSNWASRKRRR